jgi:putative transposase
MNIANQRRDYFHKLSNKLAAKYDNIIIEDLNLKAMQKLWGRKVSDLAFAEFVQILELRPK